MVSTLADIALTGDGEYSLVVGLPATQYKEHRSQLKDMTVYYNSMNLVYKNKKINFIIRNVEVYPQGASALYSIENLQDGYYTLIDIGSYTINFILALVENGKISIKDRSTLYEGLMNVYSLLEENIMAKNQLSKIPNDYVHNILTHIDRDFYVEDKLIDKIYINRIISEYTENIANHIKLKYPYKTSKIVLSGGGAKIIGTQMKTHFKNTVILKNAEFANAIGYYNVCRKYFGGGNR